MKKEFEKFGVLNSIEEHRFFGRISEGWEYYDNAICINDGKEYPIVFSSALQEFRWLSL